MGKEDRVMNRGKGTGFFVGLVAGIVLNGLGVLPIWALARESHAVSTAVDETLIQL